VKCVSILLARVPDDEREAIGHTPRPLHVRRALGRTYLVLAVAITSCWTASHFSIGEEVS